MSGTLRLQTERLILREIDPERDFDGWARAMGDPQVVRYLDGKVLGRELAWRNMATVIGHWAIRGYGFFSVEDRQSGEWVGKVGPWNPEGWPEPEVGWTITPEHWGKGYAVEAGRAAIDFAFRELGWRKTVHVIQKANAASIAVARKLGSNLLRTQIGLPGITENEVGIYGQDAPWLG